MVDRLAIFGAKYLFLLIIGSALVWAVRQSKPVVKRVILFAVLIFPLSYIGGLIGGMLYDDPRPFVVSHFTPLVAHEPDNGFPSDHILLCSAASMVVVFFEWRLGVALSVATMVVAVSRVYVGVHHTIDVIGSMLIVVTVAVIVRVAIYIIEGKRREG